MRLDNLLSRFLVLVIAAVLLGSSTAILSQGIEVTENVLKAETSAQ